MPARLPALAPLLLAGLLAGCAVLDDRPIRPREAPLPVPPTAEGATPPAPEAEGPVTTGDRRVITEPELFPGTGRRVGPVAPALSVRRDPGGFSFAFTGADIATVVDAVLGETLGVSYAIDDRVTGTVTLRTAEPLAEDQVIPALENVLALNDAALVLSGGVYQVLPIEAAAARPPVLVGERAPGGRTTYGLHVVPLRFASATSLREALLPFISPGRGLIADPARILLVFTGPGTELRELRAVIDLFDVDFLAGQSFALLPLDSADPEDVVEELTAIFARAEPAAGPATPPSDAVRFLPIQRMNAVLVMANEARFLEQARVWVERLDRGGKDGERDLFVYFVENGRAEDLAAVLGEVFQVTQVDPVTGPGGGGEVALGQPQVDVFGGGGFGEGEIGTDLDAGVQGGVDAPAALQAAPVPPAAGPAPSGGAQAGEGPRIIADTRNNALLIQATLREFTRIERTLERLDVVPVQVLIEATIAQVSLTEDLEFGLRFFFEDSIGGGNAVDFSFTDLASGAVAPAFPGFNFIFDSSPASVILSALNTITNVEIVSSPQILVLDNGSARIQVGDEVPVAVQSAVSVGDPDAPIVNAIEFRDTGVILDVTPRVSSACGAISATPRVSSSGLVVLDIRQEVSSVVETTSSGIDSPTFSQSVVESSIAVHAGETAAIGGLIEDNRTNSRTGIPVLQNLPGVGALFRQTTFDEDRTELLVLLTPRVVRDQADQRRATEELRRRLTGLRQLQGTNPVLSAPTTPVDPTPVDPAPPPEE